jgi:hypothetical protein
LRHNRREHGYPDRYQGEPLDEPGSGAPLPQKEFLDCQDPFKTTLGVESITPASERLMVASHISAEILLVKGQDE